MLNCRGDKCREKLVKDYTLIPRSFTKLLVGQKKMSCTNEKLTDSYYTFEYINKTNPKDKGGLICGTHAAKHFLELLKHPGLSLYNPLSSTGPSTSKALGSNNGNKKPWNPVALELYDAINLLIICWNKPLYGELADIKEGLEKFPDKPPFDSKVKFVNAVIGKDIKKRYLTSMINDLRKTNPTLRYYKFDALDAVLKQLKIDSNFQL